MRVPAHAGCVLTLCFVLLLCRMEALRAQIAALTVENTKLKSEKEELRCHTFETQPCFTDMNSQLHAEEDKVAALQAEVTKLKGPPPPPPRYART